MFSYIHRYWSQIQYTVAEIMKLKKKTNELVAVKI